MNILPNTLYVSIKPLGKGKTSKQCLILGSDGIYYIQHNSLGKFYSNRELPKGFDFDQFELALPKDQPATFSKALKTVPTSRSFWEFALTPIVETCEMVEYEGHEGIKFPSFLNVYITHDGEYLGCQSEMVYVESIQSFVPTNPPQSILSLGFHLVGGHFEPARVSCPKPPIEKYTIIKSELLKVLNLEEGESVNVKSKFTFDMVRTISASLGIDLTFSKTRNSGSFGVGCRLTRS